MSTLESLHTKKLEHFRTRMAELQARQREGEHVGPSMAALRAEEAEYLLNVMPILKEYHQQSEAPCPSAPKKMVLGIASVENTSIKGQLYKRYMAEIENNTDYLQKIHDDALRASHQLESTCADCPGEVLIQTNDDMVCPKCARCFNYQEWGMNNLSFDQRINEVIPIYSYKRSNHFLEWIGRLQSKGAVQIPVDVIDALKLELRKARIVDAKDIDQKKVKFYLKKLKLSKYFDHVATITTILTGKRPPQFSADLEGKLKDMFDEIQKPFELYCPKTRKNFLSYSYVLRKMFELLGEDSYLEYLPTLKSSLKLYQQDQIWKKICEHLKWEYIPTV